MIKEEQEKGKNKEEKKFVIVEILLVTFKGYLYILQRREIELKQKFSGETTIKKKLITIIIYNY